MGSAPSSASAAIRYMEFEQAQREARIRAGFQPEFEDVKNHGKIGALRTLHRLGMFGRPKPTKQEEFDDSEKGHKPIAEKIAKSKSGWLALNKTGHEPAWGTAYPLALVADQDGQSGEGTSYLAFGRLMYHGREGGKSYSIELPGEQPLRTQRGETGGRGAEYSALEGQECLCGTMDLRVPHDLALNLPCSPLRPHQSLPAE